MLTKTMRYNQADFYAAACLLELICWNSAIILPMVKVGAKTEDTMGKLVEVGLRLANELYFVNGLKNDGTVIMSTGGFEYVFVTKVVAGSVDTQFHARADTTMYIRLVPEVIMAGEYVYPFKEEDVVLSPDSITAHFAIKDATDDHAQKEA